MKKVIYIIGIAGAIILAYVVMLASQTATNEIIATANASTGNWTAHPDFALAQGVMNSFPLWQWFVPGFVGIFLIAVILKSKD